jgi:uroporphyrinogen-III synthase
VPFVLLIRAASAGDLDAQALLDVGLDATADPYIEVTPCTDDEAPERIDELFAGLLQPHAWFILTSAAGIRALNEITGPEVVAQTLQQAQDRGVKFAAVGPTSAQILHDLGITDVLSPETVHTAAELVDLLRAQPAGTAVIPRSAIGSAYLPDSLTELGWNVVQRTVYETTTVKETPPSASFLKAGDFDAVVVRSPSAARALFEHCGQVPPGTAVIATGPTTAMALEQLGSHVTAVSPGTSAQDIAACVAGLFEEQGAK